MLFGSTEWPQQAAVALNNAAWGTIAQSATSMEHPGFIKSTISGPEPGVPHSQQINGHTVLDCPDRKGHVSDPTRS